MDVKPMTEQFVRYDLPTVPVPVFDDPFKYKGSIDVYGNMKRLRQYMNIMTSNARKLRTKLTPQKRKKHARLMNKNRRLFRREVQRMLDDIDRYALRRNEHRVTVQEKLNRIAMVHRKRVSESIERELFRSMVWPQSQPY